MAKFTSTTDQNAELKLIEIPNNESRRVYLVDVKARVATDIEIISGKSITAKLNSSPFDGPKGIWIIDLKGVEVGKTILQAKFGGKVVATSEVNIFTKTEISLPSAGTVEGMLCRLFIAESINPNDATNYNEANVKQAMTWMRLVLENRLKHKDPGVFYASKPIGQAKHTMFDIVRAKGQFKGFGDYPVLSAKKTENITSAVAFSNNYNHPLRESYARFIENAKAAARSDGLKGVSDPSPKGLYGWRTKGSEEPGGDLVGYKDLAGQTFYTVK